MTSIMDGGALHTYSLATGPEPGLDPGESPMADKVVPACLLCERTDAQTPLVALRYRGEALWICPQHLPVLIHDPHALADVLPGAGELAPAEHRD